MKIEKKLPPWISARSCYMMEIETSEFLRSLKYKCKLCDSLAMLLQVCSTISANLKFSCKESASTWIDLWISNARVELWNDIYLWRYFEGFHRIARTFESPKNTITLKLFGDVPRSNCGVCVLDARAFCRRTYKPRFFRYDSWHKSHKRFRYINLRSSRISSA